ncbi:signal peptidase I [Hymenobacter defluvii]|uniref:Signal peptidase I n=1 Tax=Hymenobacter defluvii TaxID=2054411 RepID=A0ABS3TFI1_9BACT|nr:signal peptidase I [Hymenobacter defluvii]MBO3271933.1 signal peptidase I [Hymenobacter defluvii]
MAVQSWEDRLKAQQAKPKPPQHKKAKSVWREWGDAILFAVVAATLIRWATFEAYTIPTPSMEHSLLVGDYLFVSKLHYGPRTPQTPLQVPLTHQTIWGTNLPSYSDAIQLPSYRLPGFSEVKRNDVVVFNVPFESQFPADLRTNYIKRCIGTPGDVLEIKDTQVYINGKPIQTPVESQSTYDLVTTAPVRDKFFQEQSVLDYQIDGSGMAGGNGLPYPSAQTQTGDYVYQNLHMTNAAVSYFRQQPYVKNLVPTKAAPGVANPTLFPNRVDYPSLTMTSATERPWNVDNYGPLPVPKAGQTVTLTPENAGIYYKIVARYEHNEGITWQNGMIYQNGKPLTSYTIKQNYYFMMGDNRHNSEDSRFWGFVPEDHIVGKAVLIWMSVDPYADFFHKIRWSRLFNLIKD